MEMKSLEQLGFCVPILRLLLVGLKTCNDFFSYVPSYYCHYSTLVHRTAKPLECGYILHPRAKYPHCAKVKPKYKVRLVSKPPTAD